MMDCTESISGLVKLIIAPKGIEITNQEARTYSLLLIIAPKGIEILIGSRLDSVAGWLIIAPKGIEIHHVNRYRHTSHNL